MYCCSTWIAHYNYIITVLIGVLQYYCNTVMSNFSMVLDHNLQVQHYCNGYIVYYNIHYGSVAQCHTKMANYCVLLVYTVQITFIFIGQTHLVFGKRVCTCVMKHSNAFRTFLNWLKNSKRVWHERKLHIMRVPLFANFDR